MKFWKLHGIGNDFVAIDGRFDNKEASDYSEYAKAVCHRKFSVGADGLLVNTLDGVKKVKINLKGEEIDTIKVNMGNGSFLCEDIPAISNNKVFIGENIDVLDKNFEVNAMLMGVPHVVILVDDISIEEVCKYGPLLEKNKNFPKGTNVNFVKIEDNNNIIVSTWERGCGYTLGCGTGMTASAIICNYLGKVNKSVNAKSEGGCVKIDIDDFVYMTGPAVKICEGTLEV